MADNFNLRSFLTENKLTKNAKLLKEGSDYGFDDVMDAIADDYTPGTPEFQQMEDAVEDAFYNNQVDTSEFGHDPSAPSREMRAIAKQIGLDETASKETVKENIMTSRERRLVEMVNKALEEGYDTDRAEKVVGSDGVTRYIAPDESPAIDRMYDSDEYGDALANAGTNEGDEMAQETVIPEYNTIDELMNSIDHGTNKVAEEHKMQEMKKIAEALRMKAKKMEESEHAAHISPKDLKQLATDAAKLEKAAEKLKAAFDKKFNKKEKPAAAPKAEKVEALQEGTFDLRKFLAENKLTAGSRMLNEEITLNSPSFKNLVTKVQEISDKSENDWDTLKAYLKAKYPMFSTYTTGNNPAAYVVNFFAITKGEDEDVKKDPSAYVQIGDWYVRPW